jgi:polar amino acid transport system substrate-binding protein
VAKDLLGDENKVQFVLTEAANRVEYLKANKVDIIFANFTVTPEREQVVDFAKPYLKVALGVVSPKDKPITDLAQLKDQTLLVNKGTTADSFFSKQHPEIKLQKYEQNTETFDALKDGRGVALAHDNLLVLAWAKENPNYTVGITNLGEQDLIAPAVRKGNKELLDWLNQDLEKLAKQGVIHQAYEKTLKPVYGDGIPAKDLIIE